MPYLEEGEIDRIWNNTKRYRTAEFEVAVLYDLFDGLKKSGYYFPPEQETAEQNYVPFLLLERQNVGKALEVFCGKAAFSMRIWSGHYDDGKLGLHPSSILSSEDLSANPELLVLLTGEVGNWDYYDGRLKIDSRNKEIVLRRDRNAFDVQEHNETETKKGRARTHGFPYDEALETANQLASDVVYLSTPDGRREHRDIGKSVLFTYEREMGENLGLRLGFTVPHIYVEGRPLYEVGTLSYNSARVRELEERLANTDNPKAQEGISRAIEQHKEKVAFGESGHFPSFRF